MKKKYLSKINWTEVITISLALISLYFSWRANQFSRQATQIALQASLPHMALLTSEKENSLLNGEDFCSIRMTVSNLGGAATAITGYDVTLLRSDKKIIVADINSEIALLDTEALDIPDNQVLYVYLLPKRLNSLLIQEQMSNLQGTPSKDLYFKIRENLIFMPYEFAQYSTVDVYVVFEHLQGNIEIGPITAYASLNFANGDILTSPSFDCY